MPRPKFEIPDIALERKLWTRGFLNVAGLDEAGRGPWAGPVTAGAVIIRNDSQIVGIVTDSKKMSPKKRDEAYDLIKQTASGWGIGEVSAADIDQLGIQKAVQLAMTLALKQAEQMVGAVADYLIIDGKNVITIAQYQMEKMNKGDLKHYSIAAASVLAKVYRDRLMQEYSSKYPEYGFESHKGYGTAFHSMALAQFGPCDIHRKSYKPVAAMLK